MRFQEFSTEALVHRAHVGSSDPNDIWHVRDDRTRKLRARRAQVVLANAQPVVMMSRDAMRSRTYNASPSTGKRYQLLGGYHYAYLQGDLKSQLPNNVDQGRQLQFKNGQFIYADTGESFAGADYVYFAPDRSVTAYNNQLKESLHFVRPGELRGSYTDQQMLAMGFRRSQNGSWYIDQRRWDQLVQRGQLREFAPDSAGGAQSYYTSTENFVNAYRQQKAEEIQELTDDGWSAEEIRDFKTGVNNDIHRFQQVQNGFLRGLKPGFDNYLQMDTMLKDQLGCHWIDDNLSLNDDWSKVYGEPWGNDEAC